MQVPGLFQFSMKKYAVMAMLVAVMGGPVSAAVYHVAPGAGGAMAVRRRLGRRCRPRFNQVRSWAGMKSVWRRAPMAM